MNTNFLSLLVRFDKGFESRSLTNYKTEAEGWHQTNASNRNENDVWKNASWM